MIDGAELGRAARSQRRHFPRDQWVTADDIVQEAAIRYLRFARKNEIEKPLNLWHMCLRSARLRFFELEQRRSSIAPVDQIGLLHLPDRETGEVQERYGADCFQLHEVEDRLTYGPILRRVLAGLKPRYREAILLSADGFKPRQIAQMFNITDNAAKVLCYKARRAAQAIYKELTI